MKKATYCIVLALGLIALMSGTANAVHSLHIYDWMVGGAGHKIAVYDGVDWHTGTYGAGAFAWKLDGVVKNTPLYCLDVFHTFNWGNTWDVESIPIPPDPPDPPPFNTAEAAWIYQNYAYTGASNEAQGVQLALWEISHDQQWRSGFGGGWWKTGSFMRIGSTANLAFQHAHAILQTLYGLNPSGLGEQAIYYQPYPYDGNEYYGQGQIGDVPEPGTAILLGAGLISVAGLAWRRRRS